MKSLVKRLINAFGYEIKRYSKFSFNYDYEQEAMEAISIIKEYSMVSYEPLVSLFQQVRYCEINNLSGDYVECGVWKGGASGLMALGNIKYGNRLRNIHMFDIFDDICEPDPTVDGKFALNQVSSLSGYNKNIFSGKLQPVKGVYNSHGGPGTVKIVKELIEIKIGYDRDYLHYYEGWFQDTLPKVSNQIHQISILRLDGDFYASTKVCLDFLYAKVVSGGIIILDDYGLYEGCKKATDEFREKHGITSYMNHVNQDCRYWIKE